VSRNLLWEPCRIARQLFVHCCGCALSLEVRIQALRRHALSSYRSPPKASNNSLKSAKDVSTNTPRLPSAPMHAVHSPPEYAQPCYGTQFMPLRSVNEEAKVLNVREMAAQYWAVFCANSSDMSILAS
jgi:hypothetical protein